MPGNAAVKNTARVLLRGLWPQLITATFLLLSSAFICVYVVDIILSLMPDALVAAAFFIALYLVFVFAPLALGILRYIRIAAGEGDNNISLFFYYFSDMGKLIKSVQFSLMLGARLFITAIFSFFPYLAINRALYLSERIFTETTQMYLMFLSATFWVLGFIFFIILSARYYISPFLFIGCEDLEPRDILLLSKSISRKTAGSYIVFVIGMIGWILLSAFGVTMIYTVPYFLMGYIVHCRYAIYYYNKGAKLSMETEFPEYRSKF